MLRMWAIYCHPADFPDRYVIREWEVEGSEVIPSPIALLADSIEEAREKVPKGLFKLGRHPGDDPVIVEVWV
jgi:hypothetical protein